MSTNESTRIEDAKYAEFTPVRSAARPMAFTRREFWRGVCATWVTAMILLVLFLVITSLITWTPSWGSPVSLIFASLLYGIPVGGIVMTIASVIASPLAWALGRALERTRKIPLHLVSFGLLGAIIGALAYLVNAAITNRDIGAEFSQPTIWVLAAASALAVIAGWCWTVRKSRREQVAPSAS